MAGSVMVSGAQISADLLAIPLFVTASSSSTCTLPTTPDVTLTGTVQNAKLNMTSANWGGTTLTVTGTVSTDGQSISGSWSAKGGCIDGQSGSFVANYVPPLTGTWAGTASNLPTSLSGTTTTSPLAGSNVTFQLQQSSTPDGYRFPLSGTVTVSGANCGFTNGTLLGPSALLPQPISAVTGDTWNAVAQMDDGKSALIAAVGALPAKPGQWLTVFGVSGGACAGAVAQATLTKQ